jgi:hypothetical protein
MTGDEDVDEGTAQLRLELRRGTRGGEEGAEAMH